MANDVNYNSKGKYKIYTYISTELVCFCVLSIIFSSTSIKYVEYIEYRTCF